MHSINISEFLTIDSKRALGRRHLSNRQVSALLKALRANIVNLWKPSQLLNEILEIFNVRQDFNRAQTGSSEPKNELASITLLQRFLMDNTQNGHINH